MSVLSAPYLHDEAAAYQELESLLWPNDPVCPRCKGQERITSVKGGRIGLYRCGPCKRQFTVKVGTVFESSHVPLNQWLQAVYLMCSSKKGISSRQLMQTLDVQYMTARFMTHRIRAAMKAGDLPPISGAGQKVEIDETFIGNKEGVPVRRGYAHKHAVMTPVERGGSSCSFRVDGTSAKDRLPIITANVHPDTRVMTNEAGQYTHRGKHFTEHDFVRHAKGEYGRGQTHTKTVDGAYSGFKRGMKRMYQHCSEEHLHRYVAEFDFRYDNRVKLGVDDDARTGRTSKGIVERRITYKSVDRAD